MNVTNFIIYLYEVQLDNIFKDLIQQSRHTSDFWIICVSALKKEQKNSYSLMKRKWVGGWEGILLSQIGPNIFPLGDQKMMTSKF